MYKFRYIKEKLFIVSIAVATLIALTPLLHMIAVILVNGLQVVAKAGLRFFTDIPPPPLSKDIGGIAPALIGSLITTLLSLPISILLALSAAILSTEFPLNPVSKIVDTLSRSFASIPTIVVSMVIYTVVVVPMGMFSALAGAIALSLISLPYAYTSFSAALRAIPQTYREASYSIGMNRWKTILKVFIPIARKAVTVGVLITFARAMGETAALLFTVGRYRAGISYSITSPTDAIPLLIFDYILTPFKVYHEVAWGATFILLIIYMVIFVTIKITVKEVKL